MTLDADGPNRPLSVRPAARPTAGNLPSFPTISPPKSLRTTSPAHRLYRTPPCPIHATTPLLSVVHMDFP